MELFQKRQGKRFDHEEKKRKREAREAKDVSKKAQELHGIKGKRFAKERYKEKVEMKKKIKAHEQKEAKVTDQKAPTEGAVPAYLMDRNEVNRTKVLSNMIKQKRKEKAGKWKVPIDKVKPMSEDEMFKVMKSGKRK
jgi:ribosome biogenesis protein NSA2